MSRKKVNSAVDEEWRPVVGYEGRYEVSDMGRVRSVKRRYYNTGIGRNVSTGGVVRSLIELKNGYLSFGVKDETGKSVTLYVHQEVCNAFYGPKTPEKPVVRHLNGDKKDNRLVNLARGTHKENSQDAITHGHDFGFKRLEFRCKRGHLYTEENTNSSKGYRKCKECAAFTQRERAKRGLLEGDKRHGTVNGFVNFGCRCYSCIEANKDYLNKKKEKENKND